jgi:hypothetical protein
VPASLVALALLLVLFVPGYLFQAGVREHRSVLSAERDLYAVAQAVAISAGGVIALLFSLRVLASLGVGWADSLQAELLHDPSAGEQWSLSLAQEILLICLLVFPAVFGRIWGWSLARRDEARGRRGQSRGGVFFPDSPTQRRIDRLASSAHKGRVYVRVVRQGEEDVVGLLDRAAAEATMNPLGQGIALSARWSPFSAGPGNGDWQQLPGIHIGPTGVVEIQQWNERVGALPLWLAGVQPAREAASGTASPQV